jgi:hypothetical protein
VIGGDLVLTGDGLGNSISVAQNTSNGDWTIFGNVSNGSLTTINNQSVVISGRRMSFVTLRNVNDDVRIDLNGGNDSVHVYGNYGSAFVPDDLEIETDGGADTVTLSSVNVGDDITINTGAQNDSVWIQDVQVGTEEDDGDLTIRAGTGSDRVTLRNLTTSDDVEVTGEDIFEGYIGLSIGGSYSEAWRYPNISF